MNRRQIYSNNIVISTVLPVREVLEIEIIHRENVHGCAKLTAHIQEEDVDCYIATEVFIYQLKDDRQSLLFRGKIDSILIVKFGAYARAEIRIYTETKKLDGEIHNRSFQDIYSTYSEVAEQVIQGWKGDIVWNKEKKQQIEQPIIQYQENDWQFLQRLASHFHTALYPMLTEHLISIGWSYGKERKVDRIIEEGISDLFYIMREDSGITDKKKFSYLKVASTEEWQIGDYLIYSNLYYVVYRRNIKYINGELLFYYDLGTEGTTYIRTLYADKLKGITLKGTICKVIQESVTLQLDIDKKEESSYAWPWTPEIGNVCYFMPEVKTEAMLYFPTGIESEGLVLCQVRQNGDSTKNINKKEVVTAEKKKLSLYSNEIIFETLDGSVRLIDGYGVKLVSGKKIRMIAKGNINIVGRNVTVIAPSRITCKTSVSNIEMCKNFNFYAPEGVQKIEKKKDAISTGGEQIEENEGYYQSAFAALAAIPTSNCAMDTKELEIRLMTDGTIPKIGNGVTTYSMMEIMEGKKRGEVNFPNALDSMDNYTNNGSYALLEE